MRYVISYTDTDVVVHGCANQREVDAIASGADFTHVRLDAKCDLSDIPMPVLVRLYNQAGGPAVARFRDRETAEKRVRPLVSKIAGPPKQSEPAVEQPRPKSPGVIATIRELMERPEGATVSEAVARLTSIFPDRPPQGMATTVRIQVNRLAKANGRSTTSVTEEGRGRVYRLV
jgi:hypothetical protein